MKNFDSYLTEAIDEVTQDPDVGHFTSASDLLRQLKDAETSVQNLRMQVRHLTEQLVAELGTEIRKRQPGIEVGLKNGRCACGYKSRIIECAPDIENGTWTLGGSSFARRFSKTYPHLMKLNDDIIPLAHALADFFGKHYKRLGTFQD